MLQRKTIWFLMISRWSIFLVTGMISMVRFLGLCEEEIREMHNYCFQYFPVSWFSIDRIILEFFLGQGHEITKSENVYSLLKNTACMKQNVKLDVSNTLYHLSEKSGVEFTHKNENGAINGLVKLESISKSLRSFLSVNDIVKLSQTLRSILYKSVFVKDFSYSTYISEIENFAFTLWSLE